MIACLINCLLAWLIGWSIDWLIDIRSWSWHPGAPDYVWVGSARGRAGGSREETQPYQNQFEQVNKMQNIEYYWIKKQRNGNCWILLTEQVNKNKLGLNQVKNI